MSLLYPKTYTAEEVAEMQRLADETGKPQHLQMGVSAPICQHYGAIWPTGTPPCSPYGCVLSPRTPFDLAAFEERLAQPKDPS